MSEPKRLEFRISNDLEGERLDKVLARLVPEHSRARLREMIEDGRLWIDGEEVLRPAHTVESGMRLSLDPIERDRTRSGRQGLEFTVVHEEESFCVLEKPAGMVTHAGDAIRGGTLAELAVERWGPLPDAQGEQRPGIVHRLDAETSGLIVIARSEPAAAALMAQFKQRQIEKTYLAIVHGDPRFDSEWIDADITRSDRSHDRMAAVEQGEGRSAETYYEVLERWGRFALLRCQPKTGRTHQIRVHLAHVGHPVAHDRLYRGRRKLELPGGAPALERHALHAAGLSFAHPESGAPIAFESALPADMQAFVDWLREQAARADED